MLGTQPPITAGTLLAGKYRVERVLGTGGMGVVVAAMHEALDERVAVKLLRTDRIAQTDAIERALREARATVKIQSEHVVRVFDVGTLDGGSPYIVMEYLAGCDLAQLLCAEGQLDIADAASYVRQACDAVVKAHAIGIVHRDLKPANLFLAVRDEQTTIKVLDFGISKFIASDSGRVAPSLTHTAAVLGSPAYMSPEQLESPREVDGRTDVWSLGVILFELLTGAHPFVAETLPQLYKRIAEQPAPSLRSLRPDAPPDLEAIVGRCLEKDRSNRFADAAALSDALAPFAQGAEREASRVLPALAETGLAADEQVESARLRSKISGPAPVIAMGVERTTAKRRRRLLFGGSALAATAFAATVGLYCVKPSRDKAAPAASPLVKAGSVLACPPLVASGVEEPSGWLGAAAASVACTRAQARMGGRAARTLVPAELLDLPQMPVDNFPEDAFADKGARDKAIAAAKVRGSAWLDGSVARDNDGFHVTLVLRAGEREIARGSGSAKDLLDAMRSAMQPIEKRAIPPAADGDPFVREWLGAGTADGAVAMTDWMLSRSLEWPNKGECDRVLAREDILSLAKSAVRNWCDQGSPSSVRDNSSPGLLLMSLEADSAPETRNLDKEVSLLDRALANATDHEVRAHLLSAKANMLVYHLDYDGATKAALEGVRESPKALTPWSTAWGTLSWVRAASNAAPAANAWVPWNTEAYCFAATRNPDPELRVRYMRRNFTLTRASMWLEALVEFLVSHGKRDEARALATGLGPDGAHVIVEASEMRLGKALELGRRQHESFRDDQGWAAAYNLVGVGQVDLLLERPIAGVDDLIRRYFDVPKSPFANDQIGGAFVTFACVLAPRDVSRRCFDRLRKLSGGVVGFMPGMLEGAERYSQGDYAGAAKAWKRLATSPGWQLDAMHDLIAIAFERGGEPELAAALDAFYVKLPGRFNGADLVHVREAKRAELRGDDKRARELAVQVIDAWAVSDIPIPAVAAMRKLVARVDARARVHKN